MPNVDEVLAGIVAKTKSVRICLRGDLLAAHDQAVQDLAAARRGDEIENRHPEAPTLARRLVELEEQMAQCAVEFTFRSIGKKAWTDLMVAHPPSDAQRSQGMEFDPTSFPVAAVAAACTAPEGMSIAKAEQLTSALNDGQWRELWLACLDANVIGTDVPFSLAASALLRGSEMKSEQPGSSEPPEASSSDA